MVNLRYLRLAMLGVLILSACGGPAPASSASNTASPAATTAGTAARTATLHEIVNEVQTRAFEADPLRPAAEGDQLGVGGQVQTGADSQARLDLTEGTIVRLAPSSEFTLKDFPPDPASPATTLSLTAGQGFVILIGGSPAVETPVGSATVRGSYLGVNFDPIFKRLIATCLEGTCELKNGFGTTPLTNNQAAEIAGEGQPPSPPRPLAPAEIQQWTLISPEARQLAPLGTPGTPDPDAPPPGGGAGDPFGPGGAAVTPSGPDTNTQPLRYSFTNACDFTAPDGTRVLLTWHIKFEGPATRTIDLAPGESSSGELPAGRYTGTAWNDEGLGGGTRTFDSDAGPVSGAFCQDTSPPAGGGSLPPPDSPGAPSGNYVNTRPLNYTFTNNCIFTAPDGSQKKIGWHWVFEGDTTIRVDIPAGESRSGQIPPGRYTVYDYDDEGRRHDGGTLDTDFASDFNVTSCQQP